jgi:hypothetical protein
VSEKEQGHILQGENAIAVSHAELVTPRVLEITAPFPENTVRFQK